MFLNQNSSNFNLKANKRIQKLLKEVIKILKKLNKKPLLTIK